jgi:DnaJ-class molecular chaperone
MGGRHKDYYSVLGVPRDAGADTIRRAYRCLVKRLHPDAGLVSSAEAFHEVRAAFETLSNAERRRRYDETLAFAESDWFVRSVPFAAPATAASATSTRAVAGEIVLTKAEARAGGVLPLQVPVESACSQCRGTGGRFWDCDACGGDGSTERRVPLDIVIPPGVADGAVIQVALRRPTVALIFSITVRPF